MKLRLTVLLMIATISGWAQDPEFSMPNTSPLYLNPSMAGIEVCPRVAMNYRNQWPKIGDSHTMTFSFDKYFRAMRGGMGVLYTRDIAGNGSFRTQNFRVMYAAHINLGAKHRYLRPSVYGGYGNKKVNIDDLTFGTMVDPRYGYIYDSTTVFPTTSAGYLDFGAGLLYNSRRLLFSIALDHINQPDEGIFGVSRLPMKIKGYVQCNLEFNALWCFNPQLFYAQQQDFQQVVPMVAFNYAQTLKFGGGTRFNPGNFDAVIGMVGLGLKGFTIQYSYDYTVSKLGNSATGGSHEFGVRYTFGCKGEGEDGEKYFERPAFGGF